MNIVLEPEQFDKIDFFTRLVIVLVPDEIVILRTFYLLDVKNELKNFDTNPNKRDIYKILTDLYGVEDGRITYQKVFIWPLSPFFNLAKDSYENTEFDLYYLYSSTTLIL